MRNDFVKQIMLEMKRNNQIVFLTGDLGFNALEPIKKAFPKRFFNVGIAEANMVGLAAGLALGGKKVIAYSIASFATMRCYEQIRTDICYHNLDVKIIGTGGGFNYIYYGVTHHTIEDVAIMSVLPNMTVVCPGHSWEATEATRAILAHSGPAYLRLGKSPGVNYAKPHWRFALGRGFVIKEGREGLLLVTGNLLDRALAIAALVEARSRFRLTVISLPTLKPLDRSLILRRSKAARAIFTLEEHSGIGGLGASVASLLMPAGLVDRSFQSFALPDRFIKVVGKRDYLLDQAGLGTKQVASAILKQLRSK